MKVNKLIVGLATVFLVAAAPVNTSSKDSASETIVLSKNNLIVLNTQVDGESTAKVISEAKALDEKLNSGLSRLAPNNKPLYVFLNTPGGSIQSGLEMIEALRGIGRPVNTITLFAASMGFQLAQNLDTRYIIKNGVLMSHRAKGGFEGEFGGQAPSQIESRYALWKSRLDEMDTQTVARTNGKQTLESYQKQYASEMWLTGAQSVSQGYADKVVTVKCDSSLSGSTTHEVLAMGIIPVQYDLDNCPLNTSPMNIRVGIFTNKGLVDSKSFIEKGGEFGPHCLTDSVNNKDKLCALDTSLNMEKIKDIKIKFVSQFEKKAATVVDMF